MECDNARLALSARLDGEDMMMPSAELDAHLHGCARCQAWLAGAERITRAIRVQPVEVPDLTVRILDAVQADGPPARERAAAGLRSGIRWALGLLAVVQIMLAVPDLLGAIGHEAHAGREVAAFDIALAVGLLMAACYPEHARVFAPVVVALVFCFASISALDVLQGVVTPGRVAIHALAVAQAVLVWALAHWGPAPSGRGPHQDGTRPIRTGSA